jgi:nitrite reductase/ring-hydroxylating ferredoxin subunit
VKVSDPNKPRRVFLKVLATGPLLGCAGADPASSLPGGSGGGDGSAGGMASTSAGGSTSGGNVFVTGGSASGGNVFVTGGNSNAGFSFSSGGSPGGTSLGGTATTTGGTSTNLSLVPAGNVSAIPVGKLTVVAGIFLMGRDANGIYAMSMQCTHKGCALVFSGAQLDCPCHHSRFDANGNVLVGPATAPLPHLAVTVDASGNITVDRYAVVSASTRTAV